MTKLDRREFLRASVRQGLVGAAVPLAALCAQRSPSKQISVEPKLTGHLGEWNFVGSNDWTQDDQGVLYSPVWNQCIARKDGNDLLKREDFAYPFAEFLAETDVSVEFRTFAWSLETVGLVFRSQDSVRYYYVEVGDRGVGDQYAVRILIRDITGYRRELASTFITHVHRPDNWYQIMSSQNREEWAKITPGWIKLRVQAQRNVLRVFAADQQILEVNDASYPAGRVGLLARGPGQFRNLSVSGERAALPKPWKDVGELPSYFYPWPDAEKQFGDNQSYPGILRMANGDLGVWMGVTGNPHRPDDVLLVWSRDQGKTWSDPILFKKRPDVGQPGYFFGYPDGRLSCLYATTYDWETKSRGVRIAYSLDRGKTWSEPEPLLVSGKPLNVYGNHSRIGPYSPITRLSNGTLLQFYYEVNLTPDGKVVDDEQRRDRSLLIHSLDNGRTWEGPFYIAPDNYDSNECMAVERSDGTLISFARTLSSPYMWMSTSQDKGKTWTKQVQSNVSGASPILLRHSSGVLIMGSRDWGTSLTTSVDDGKTWSRPTVISVLTGMMGMAEIRNGRVLIVHAEGYRVPSRIRGQFFGVSRDGTLTPAPAS